MFKEKDFLVYKKDVCEVLEIKNINGENYYILVPINDNSLKVSVPVSSKFIRNLISISELNNLIEKIPSIPLIESSNKLIENDYKELLKDGSYESLIKIIKTTYLRNKERVDNNKKKADKDEYYFNLAEKYLYTEFSVVLNKTFDETRDFIVNKVSEINR